jgi:hypothetical protein
VGGGKEGDGYWLVFTGPYQGSLWDEENVNQRSNHVMVILMLQRRMDDAFF